MKRLADSSIHKSIIDYYHFNGITSLNELDSYVWPIIIQGRHCCLLHNEESDATFSYLCPVLNQLLKAFEKDFENSLDKSLNPTAYDRVVNGPKLIIVCSSCKNAQAINQVLDQLIDMAHRTMIRRLPESLRYLANKKKKFECILLQGDGDDNEYAIPLLKGCDILIAATPYCLLRQLGLKNTNLERLQYFVLDEAQIVLDRFAKPVSQLMSIYNNLLETFDGRRFISQIIVSSSRWSNRLRKFCQTKMFNPVIAGTNKIEASFFGRTYHSLYPFLKEDNRLDWCIKLIEEMSKNAKNCVIFTNSHTTAKRIHEHLIEINFSNVDCAHELTHHNILESIESKWLESIRAPNKNRILVCSDKVIESLQIDNAQAVIHFDFPHKKNLLSDRLWFMRRYFQMDDGVCFFVLFDFSLSC
jgi:superfamily II DNA/RNA helicase